MSISQTIESIVADASISIDWQTQTLSLSLSIGILALERVVALLLHTDDILQLIVVWELNRQRARELFMVNTI